MNKFITIIAVVAIAFTSQLSFARGSFGGSRGGSSSGSSRSSGSSSSFGGSRSGSSNAGKSSGSGSSFGGSRSSKQAPIVRKSPPSQGSSSGSTSSTTNVYHNYGGYGGYYGSSYYSGGFMQGFLWGQFFNRPQVVYVNGNSYVQGPNGQPLMDNGQAVEYHSNPLLTALAAIVWLGFIALVVWFGFFVYRSYENA